MANGIYLGDASNKAREVSEIFMGVGNVARQVSEGYIGVNNVARMFYGNAGTPLSDLDIGTSIYVPVNSTPTEFILVNKGLPSDAYHSSCNGAWLMAKDLIQTYYADALSVQYTDDPAWSYLNDTYYTMIDTNIANSIIEVSIPTTSATYNSITASAKVFLPSAAEVGEYDIMSESHWDSSSSGSDEGSILEYFSPTDLTGTYPNPSKRIAYYEGAAKVWKTRTKQFFPFVASYPMLVRIGTTGAVSYMYASTSSNTYWLRPTFILPLTQCVDENMNVLA